MRNLKKMLLAGLLVFSLSSSPAFASDYHFKDTAQLSWAAPSVQRLYQKGIIKDGGQDVYRPYASITRAELTALLARATKSSSATKTLPFNDVRKGQWFYDSIQKMYSMGVIKGVSETQFEPNRMVTREEAAVIIARTFHYSHKAISPTYRDRNAISPWARNSVVATTEKGVFSGENNQFRPKSPLTRAEAAIVIDRILYGKPEPYVAPKTVQAAVKLAPKPAPTTTALASRSTDLLNSRLVKVVQSVLGTPYQYGGTTTSGFDCSGFTRYVYKQLGVDLPRDSRSQFSVGQSVSTDQMQKGDLIFFDTGGGVISHVGIYMGNNNMAHAASSKVQIDSLDWYYSHYKVVGVKRVL